MSLGKNGSATFIVKYTKIVRCANSSIRTKCWKPLRLSFLVTHSTVAAWETSWSGTPLRVGRKYAMWKFSVPVRIEDERFSDRPFRDFRRRPTFLPISTLPRWKILCDAKYSPRTVSTTRYFRFALEENYCSLFVEIAVRYFRRSREQNDSVDQEFESTCVSCELRRAIEKSYSATAVNKIWNYRVELYDPVTR